VNYARSSLVVLLVVVGALCALTANAAVWATRTVFDTDTFVSTTNRVLDEEEVQQQLATQLSTILVERGEVEVRLREELPEGMRFLAPILTITARDLAYEAILRLLDNDKVRDGLDASLRLVHQQVLRIIEGEGAVVVQNDQVVLDLTVILQQAAERLNLEPNFQIELPEGAGQVILVEDAQTASAVQELLALHRVITWLVIGIAVLALALAVLIARDRRGTLRNVGIVLVACGLLAIVVLFPLRPIAASFADNQSAARAAFDAFILGYRIQSFFLIVLGAGAVVVATLLGQSDLAKAVRGTVRRQPGEPAPDLAGALRNNAAMLRVLGLISGALILAAWPEPSNRVYITTFALLAFYFVVLWVFTSTGERASSIREQAAQAWGRVDGVAGDERNITFAGRHVSQLRVAGIALAVVAMIVIPNLGLGAIAGIVAMTFVYLAAVDWLATREA